MELVQDHALCQALVLEVFNLRILQQRISCLVRCEGNKL
jgi:hypothetical protein